MSLFRGSFLFEENIVDKICVLKQGVIIKKNIPPSVNQKSTIDNLKSFGIPFDKRLLQVGRMGNRKRLLLLVAGRLARGPL